MKYKKGQDLYSLCVDDDGKCEMDVYRVRTIRGGLVYAILVTSFTWGKRSKKNGDWGWLDPIPYWCRYCRRVGESFSTLGLHTTKRAAWADKNNLKYLDPEPKKKAARTIKSALSKIKNSIKR